MQNTKFYIFLGGLLVVSAIVLLPFQTDAAELKPHITWPENGKHLHHPAFRIQGTTLPGAQVRIYVNGERRRKNETFFAREGKFDIGLSLRGKAEEQFNIAVVARKHKQRKKETFTVSLAKSFTEQQKTIRLTGDCVGQTKYIRAFHANMNPNVKPKDVYTPFFPWPMEHNLQSPFYKLSSDNTFTMTLVENVDQEIVVTGANEKGFPEQFEGKRHIKNSNEHDVIDIHTYCMQ